jgi:hypothetical protein
MAAWTRGPPVRQAGLWWVLMCVLARRVQLAVAQDVRGRLGGVQQGGRALVA